MKPIKVKLSELVLDPKNARHHSARNIEAIKASLQENEQYRPFVVQRGTNKIAIGNGMYLAMKELGVKEGWVEYRDLNDKQFTRLALADNRTAELADWNEDMLKSLLCENDIGQVPGFDGEEIAALLNDAIENSAPVNADNELPYQAPYFEESEPVNVFGSELNAGKGQPDQRRTYGMLDKENVTTSVCFDDIEIRVPKKIVEPFMAHLNEIFESTGQSIGEQLSNIFLNEINKS